MKKLFRKLFSPTTFVILILLLEFLAIIFVLFIADVLFSDETNEIVTLVGILLRAILFFIQIFIFFRIINKYENPEFKVTWIAFMSLLPMTTTIMYLIFANHGLRRKDKKIILPTNQILDAEFTLKEDEIEDFRENVPLEYRSIFKYLRKVTHLTTSKDNELKYYKNGEQFFPDFIQCLKEAQEFIFMEFFIIGEGKEWSMIEQALIDRADHGVEVRLIYDDVGSFGLLPSSYPRKLAKHGIKCYKFHKVSPILSGVYNNRTHRKIAVIDHKYGFTGGMNLADEYANDIVRFGYWKDTMIRIEGRGIENLIATFLQNYDLSCHKISDYNHYLDATYEKHPGNGYMFFFGDGPGSFDGNEPIGEQNYLNLINNAKREIWICTPYLIPTYRLTEALRVAAKKGVQVNLFVPGIPDKRVVYWMAKCDFHILTEAGVNIYTYTPGFNHEKEILVDDIIGCIGTINFDFRSLTHHFECGATIYNDPVLKDFKEDFLEMQSVSKKIEVNFKPNLFQRMLCAVLKLFRTLI